MSSGEDQVQVPELELKGQSTQPEMVQHKQIHNSTERKNKPPELQSTRQNNQTGIPYDEQMESSAITEDGKDQLAENSTDYSNTLREEHEEHSENRDRRSDDRFSVYYILVCIIFGASFITIMSRLFHRRN